MSPDRRRCLILLGLSVAVHTAAAIAVHVTVGGVDGYAFRSVDGQEYYRLGVNLTHHGSFSTSESAPFAPDTWRTPGYPLFLSFFIALFGDSPLMLVIVQQGLRVLNVALFFLLARRWLGLNRGFLAAVVFLLDPYGLYYSFWLMSETWFVTVLLAAWWAWARALERDRSGGFAWTGALSAFLVLVRPVGLLVPVVLWVGLVIRACSSRLANQNGNHAAANGSVRQWVGPICFTIAGGLVLGSWMLRNKIVAEHFAISNQGGVVLAYFKATEVALWNEGRTTDRYLETSLDPARINDPHPVWDEIDRRLHGMLFGVPEAVRQTLTWRSLAQGNRSDSDPFPVSEALVRIGRSMLLESPMSTGICCLWRGFWLLMFPMDLAVQPPHGVEINRGRSFVLGAFYALLALAACRGLVRGRGSWTNHYFAVGATLALLAAATPQIDPRFRVPMIPLMLVLAFSPPRRRSNQPVTSESVNG